MQRTFVTELPDQLASNQVVVDLPRYEVPLARALHRRDSQNFTKFLDDSETLNVVTTINQIKTFTDELARLDPEIDDVVRVPYTNYVGLQFNTVADAVAWARRFVQRFFPATEERLLKKTLLMLPLDKTEIVWTGGEKYLPFVAAVATSPSTDEMVKAVPAQQPQLTIEEAQKKRAEIAARRGKKKDEAPEASTDAT